MNECKPLKTGTLTMGNPSVVDYRIFNHTLEDQFLRTVAAAESQSEHPIAKAILHFVRSKLVVGGGGDGDGSAGNAGGAASSQQQHLSLPKVDEVDIIPGEGLRQGLTLVHFSAQLMRFPSDRGCV